MIMSRQRRRTIKMAIEFFDHEIKLPKKQRQEAIEKIKNAKQPNVKAQLIVDAYRKAKLHGFDIGEMADHSDTQELYVKLVRRDGGFWSPQRELLKKLERQIVSAGMTKNEFINKAAILWAMPQTLPKSLRNAEWAARHDE